jgi:hypothetical protein
VPAAARRRAAHPLQQATDSFRAEDARAQVQHEDLGEPRVEIRAQRVAIASASSCEPRSSSIVASNARLNCAISSSGSANVIEEPELGRTLEEPARPRVVARQEGQQTALRLIDGRFGA